MPRFCLSVIFALVASLGLTDFAWADATAVSISGNVVASGSAAPMPGTTITVFRYGIFSFQPVATTTTDANGNYLVEGLELEPPSSFYVQADAGDYWIVQEWPGAECTPVPLFCGPIGSSVPVSPGQTSVGVNFSLNAGGVIQGHVTRSDTQAPVAGAGISPFYFAGTDANGAYRLRSVRPDEYTLWVDADGLITTFNDGQQCDGFHSCEDIVAQPFIVAANATTTVDVALTPGVTMSGLVLVDGAPDAPRPAVLLYNESDPQRPHIEADALNYAPLPNDYVFRNLIARTYTVRFGDPADSRYVSEYYNNVPCDQEVCDGVVQFVTVPGQQIAEIDATVAPRQKVVGRVIDADSQAPLASADVQIVVVQNTVFDSYWKAIAETHSNATGNFTLAGIPAGTPIALRVNAANHLGMQTPDVICDAVDNFCQASNTYIPPTIVVANTTLDAGDMPLSQGATISGRVTNLRDGQGLPDSQIAVYIADQFGTFGSTDSDGNYSTGMLRPGTFKVRASSLYEAQMYDHVNCAGLDMCDLGLATPIVVNGSGNLSGVDFSLHDPEIIFSSGFDN